MRRGEPREVRWSSRDEPRVAALPLRLLRAALGLSQCSGCEETRSAGRWGASKGLIYRVSTYGVLFPELHKIRSRAAAVEPASVRAAVICTSGYEVGMSPGECSAQPHAWAASPCHVPAGRWAPHCCGRGLRSFCAVCSCWTANWGLLLCLYPLSRARIMFEVISELEASSKEHPVLTGPW